MPNRRHTQAFARQLVLLVAFMISAMAAAGTPEVSGRVLDTAGEPLAGAWVELLPIEDAYRAGTSMLDGRLVPEPVVETVTDDRGWFSFVAPDTGYWLVVVGAEGHLPMEQPLAPLLGDRVLHPATLRPPDRHLEVSLDHDGAPLAGALLRFTWRRTTGLPWDGREIVRTGWRPAPRLLRLDDAGKGTVGLRDREALEWAAVAAGMHPRWGTLRNPSGSQSWSMKCLPGAPGCERPTTELRVLTPKGDAAGVLVSCSHGPRAVTDESGVAFLPGDFEERLELRTAEGHLVETTAVGGVARLPELMGAIVGASGQPGLPVHRGHALVRAAPVATWTLEVTTDDGRTFTGEVTTSAGAPTTVELR